MQGVGNGCEIEGGCGTRGERGEGSIRGGVA